MRQVFRLVGAVCLLMFKYAGAQDITWAEDVACIVYSHCSPCHNSYNNPNAQFRNYQDIHSQRLRIELYVNTGKMPPSLTNNHYNKFTGNKSLTQEEIDIIKAWAREQALEGDTSLTPEVPVYSKPVRTLTDPDITFRSNFVLPDTIKDHLRRCFIIPQGSHIGKNIQSIEVVPAYPYIVHSVFIYSEDLPYPYMLDDKDTGMGYTSYTGTGSPSSKPIYGWTLGSKPFHMPENLRLHVDPNAYLIVQLQYAEEGAGQVDSSEIHIKFDSSSSVRGAMTSALLSHDVNLVNGPFEVQIDSSKVFHEQYNVFNSMTLLSISPKAHNYCDNMRVFARLPNKDTIWLLKIDDWVADWSEGTYFYQKPVHLPKGTVINAFSLYSNTNSNLHDLYDTLETLHAGLDDHAHVDEMIFHFTYLPYSAGDENIIFDTLQHKIHHLGCAPVHKVTDIDDIETNSFYMYPNPAHTTITIETSELPLSSVIVYNSIGKKCVDMLNPDHEAKTRIDISGLPAGIYFIQINALNHSQIRRLIIGN